MCWPVLELPFILYEKMYFPLAVAAAEHLRSSSITPVKLMHQIQTLTTRVKICAVVCRDVTCDIFFLLLLFVRKSKIMIVALTCSHNIMTVGDTADQQNS